MNLNPTQRTIGELLSERLFRIPDYQRAYSWQNAQRKDLFNDIKETHKKERKHFMATIVARNTGTKTIAGDEFSVVEIVDGQQRITTLVILLKAIAKATKGREGEEGQISRKIDELLVKGDQYQTILLQTNHNASSIFSTYLTQATIAEDRATTRADRNLIDAMKDCEAFVDQSDPVELYTTVRNHLVVIYHQIDDEALVYRVFETLNSRGLDVKWLDKTKSQMMALLFEHAADSKEESLNEMRATWTRIYQILGLETGHGDEALRFAGTLKDSRRPNKTLSEANASACLLQIAGFDVATITKTARWLESVVQAHNEIVRNPRLDGVTRITQVRLLATAIKVRGYGAQDEQDLMRKWESISFRIYGLDRKDGRTKVGDYVRLAHDIIHEQLDAQTVLARLDQIGQDFPIDKVLKNPDLLTNCYEGWTTELRYLLYRYDEHLSTLDGASFDSQSWEKIWMKNASDSIEHIQPQSSGKNWVHKLGNLTMLTPGMNSSLKDKTPLEKAKKYPNAGIRATTAAAIEIETQREWNHKVVKQRTENILSFIRIHWGD